MKKTIIGFLIGSLAFVGLMGLVANAAPVTPIPGGGTGTSTTPTDGYLLIGLGGKYVFIASSSLGSSSNSSTTINGYSGQVFQIIPGQGVTSTVVNGSTTFTLNLGSGCSGNNFVATISPTGTISCAIPPGGGLASTTPFTIGNLVVVSSSGALATISSGTYYLATNPAGYLTSVSTTIPVTYISTLNGSSGTYNLYVTAPLVIATGTASTTLSCPTCGTGNGTVTTSTAVTANYFPFWKTVTGGLSGTSTIYQSSTNGFVGINNSNPQTELDIIGPSSAPNNENVSTTDLQIQTGKSSGDQILYFGNDKTNHDSWIQSVEVGINKEPLLLNPLSGAVSIATTTTNGELNVFGNTNITGNTTSTTLNAQTGFNLGTSTTGEGNVAWSNNGLKSYLGIWDTGNGYYYGFTPGCGNSISSFAGVCGYYQGVAIQGLSNTSTNPIFGVLNSTQSANGLNNTAFTIQAQNQVYTFNNTLDNGSGTATFKGTVTASSSLLVKSTSALLGDTTIASTSDNGLFSVVNASNTVAFKVASTTNATSSAVSLDILGNASTSPANPINVFQVLNDGHINATGTTPTVSSCGTGSPSVVGTDSAGVITIGTGAVASCKLTFQVPYESSNVIPIVTDSSSTDAVEVTSVSSSSITMTFASSLTGGSIYYFVLQSF